MSHRLFHDIPRIPADQLRWACDQDCMEFATTEEIDAGKDIVGQKRGLEALELGLELNAEGYNIYVCGAAGTGRSTAVRQCLEKVSKSKHTPNDICYVNNFDNEDEPRVVYLPSGDGRLFKKEMEKFVHGLREQIPKFFESEVYRDRRKEITEKIREQEKSIFKGFEQKIEDEGFTMVAVPMGQMQRTEILPKREDKPIPWEQLENLVEKGEFPSDRFEHMRSRYHELMKEMTERIKQVRDLERELSEKIQALDSEMVGPVVSETMEPVRKHFQQQVVQDYLDEGYEYIMDNLDRFQPSPEQLQAQHTQVQPQSGPGIMMLQGRQPRDPFQVFEINLFVDNAETEGAPVIWESYPNYRNLFGTIERSFEPPGIWRTDFTKIQAGSFVRANGGYLVFDARDGLTELGVWPALKTSLKRGELKIQNYDPFFFLSSVSMRPDPVKTNVNVIMIGDNEIYYLLYYRDDDFKKVFKVKAAFDVVTDCKEDAVRQYAGFIRKICTDEGLPHFYKGAVAAIVEHGVRLAGKKKKISTRFHQVADLIRESAYWARKSGSELVQSDHVHRAIENRHWRHNLLEEKVREMIEEGTILIDIEGKKAGQVNGLSIIDLGDVMFGRPSRITAETAMGRAGVINIERESRVGGPIHNKGVYILSGYLRAQYAQDKPLSMSASICFEQSYGFVDGDSASSAELYAILSSLAGVPIVQDLAVTGSVNQKGQIQPIGGVNQKIEGYFDVCRVKGLNGKQGVLIPVGNVDDLMLRRNVVEAVAEDRFSVIPVGTVDEGIQILTGLEAGRRQDDGRFPEGTVNYLVDQRLRRLSEDLRDFSKESGDAKEDGQVL